MANWTTGYTKTELDEVQERFALRFPPDLVELLQEKRPCAGFDWRSDNEEIRAALRWPLEGLLFDVEMSDFWLSAWGPRPSNPKERNNIATLAVAAAPKLIPLFGHRFIPEEPHERGNPVFSVYQTDVIYYGANLEDYFRREFKEIAWAADWPIPKRIRFWSDLVDDNI